MNGFQEQCYKFFALHCNFSTLFNQKGLTTLKLSPTNCVFFIVNPNSCRHKMYISLLHLSGIKLSGRSGLQQIIKFAIGLNTVFSGDINQRNSFGRLSIILTTSMHTVKKQFPLS